MTITRQLVLLAPSLAFVGAASLVGLVALALVPKRLRTDLSPAIPATGTAILIVMLYWLGLAIRTQWSLPITLLVVIVAAAIAWRRRGFQFEIGPLVQAGLGVLLGLLPALVILQPSVVTQNSIVMHPTSNHDSFFYVSSAEWLVDNRLIDEPTINSEIGPQSTSPAYAPALTTSQLYLRQGEHLIQALVSSAWRGPVSERWYQMQAAWLLLLPGSALALARLARLSSRSGWLGAAATGGASLLTFQALNQNSPSLLGLALFPLVLGLLVRVFRDKPLEGATLIACAVATAALVGTYPELLVFLPLGGLMLVARSPGGWRTGGRRGVILALLSIAISPWAWYLAIRTLVRVVPLATAVGEVFFWDARPATIANRYIGLTTIAEEGTASAVTFLVILAIGAGLLSSLRIPGLRWIVAGALLTIVMLWLGQGARENFYLVDRQAMITQPIVFLFVGFGYGYLVDKPPRLAGKRLAAPLGLATAVVIALATLNISTTLRFVSSSGDLHSRSITLEVREAIEWARDVGGPDGAAVTVIVDDYVERLWVADGLRDLARVSYPILTPDYFRVSSYGDGELDRYVVASATVFSDLPSNARVTENTRFVLYDTAGVDGALLGTINNFWGRETADGHSWEWMGDDGFVVVLRTDADAETVLNTAAILRLILCRSMSEPPPVS